MKPSITAYDSSPGLRHHRGRPLRDASLLQFILIEEHFRQSAALSFGLTIDSLLMWTIKEL
jgi:hypothetical protein